MLFGEKPKRSIRRSLIIARSDFIEHENLNWMHRNLLRMTEKLFNIS